MLETWLSPVSYTRGFAGLRQAKTKQRGYFVQFESRMSQTGGKADEWIPVKPGNADGSMVVNDPGQRRTTVSLLHRPHLRMNQSFTRCVSTA